MKNNVLFYEQQFDGSSADGDVSGEQQLDGSSADGDVSGEQQFDGSSADGDVSDFHELSPAIRAQYIRFRPVSTTICLRVEVYGTPGINFIFLLNYWLSVFVSKFQQGL